MILCINKSDWDSGWLRWILTNFCLFLCRFAATSWHEESGRCGLGSFFLSPSFFYFLFWGFILLTSMWALTDLSPLGGLAWNDGGPLEWFPTGHRAEETCGLDSHPSGRIAECGVCKSAGLLFFFFFSSFNCISVNNLWHISGLLAEHLFQTQWRLCSAEERSHEDSLVPSRHLSFSVQSLTCPGFLSTVFARRKLVTCLRCVGECELSVAAHLPAFGGDWVHFVPLFPLTTA